MGMGDMALLGFFSSLWQLAPKVPSCLVLLHCLAQQMLKDPWLGSFSSAQLPVQACEGRKLQWRLYPCTWLSNSTLLPWSPGFLPKAFSTMDFLSPVSLSCLPAVIVSVALRLLSKPHPIQLPATVYTKTCIPVQGTSALAQVFMCFSLHLDGHRSTASRYRVHLADCVNLVYRQLMERFQTPSFVALRPWSSAVVHPLSVYVPSTGVCSNASLLSRSIDRMWGSLPCLCSRLRGAGQVYSLSSSFSLLPSTYWFVPGSLYCFPGSRGSTSSQLVLCENFCIWMSSWCIHGERLYSECCSSAILSFL